MVGDAISTEAGRLPYEKIIHAVGPRWNRMATSDDSVYNLENCIESCFEEMKKLRLNSIAIPPISTGIFGFPLELAVKTIVKTVLRLDKKMALPKTVIFIDNKNDSLGLFERELRAATSAVAENNRQALGATAHTGNKFAGSQFT